MSYKRNKWSDIELDADGDLKIENGDFVLALSDQQHIEHIVESEKGNWRQHPLVGVGIVRFLNYNQAVGMKGQLLRKIRLQLEYDNFRVDRLALSGDLLTTGSQGIEIDATRIK
jgi:hypothetical protein